MSVYTAIYQKLAQDSDLTALLSRSHMNPDAPAIYEDWAEKGAEKPYINLTYSFSEGFHWAKREGILYIDIFASDSVQAEAIRDAVWYSLDRQLLTSEKEGQVRLYAGTDSFSFEEDNVIHWELEFTVIYWRTATIEKVNERE